MIFQISERERIRVAPIARVRFAAPRPVRSPVVSNPNGSQEPQLQEPHRIAAPPVVCAGSRFKETESVVVEKQNTKPFEDCDTYEAQGGCQTVLHQRYDGNRGDILRCNTCGRTYSARRGGIGFRSRLSQAMLEQLIDSHQKGDSIRKTSKILTLNRGTVRRYFRLLDEGTVIDSE